MLKTPLLIALYAFLIFSSCNKRCNKHIQDDFTHEVSTEEIQIQLPNSGFEMNELETTSSTSDDYYTSGVLEYIIDGEIKATVDFGDGENDSKALLIQNLTQKEFELKKEDCSYDGKKSQYKKIIIRPLIKTDDCPYIVSGIIKYYNLKDNSWAATIDFGDGMCDDIAIKITTKGTTTFNVSEYYK